MPDGTLIRNVPDGTTQSDLQRRLDASKQLAPGWEERMAISATRAKHPVLAGVIDFGTAATGLARGALNLLPGSIGDTLSPGKKYADPDSGASLAGSLVDPVALGVGLGAAKAIPYAKVLGGGLKAGAAAVGKNIVGGAAPGAVIGGLSEDGSAASGAAWGAALNIVVPPSIHALGTAAIKAWTAASSQYRAQAILKDVLGPDLAKFRAVVSRAPTGVSAAQAASSIDNDLLNALNELIVRMDKTGYFKGLNEDQIVAVVEGLAKGAGGRNQTAIRQAAEQATRNLGDTTETFAQEALANANLAGRLKPGLDARAENLGAAASSKVQDVRRLSAAQQIAENRANAGNMRLGNEPPPIPGLPRVPGRYSYPQELAGRADAAAQGAADESLVLGARSRDAAMRAKSLAENGLRPLDTGKLTGRLRGMMRDPSIGPSTTNERVLSIVADKVDEWTQKNGGVIDAKALRTIRISAVNEAIDTLISGTDPKAKAKTAARLLAKVKPAIDDAIEEAGGEGWRAYLFSYERGMRLIEQQRMAGRAFGMFKKEPGKLESLVAGNEPQLVKKVFKTEYDLGVAMGTKIRIGTKEVNVPGPRPIEDAAALLERNRKMGEGAARGETAMQSVLQEHKASFILPNWINAKIAVTNRALKELEFKVNKSTFVALQTAMKSGADANKLINLAPPEERNKVIRALLSAQDSPKTRAFLTGLLNGMEQDNQ